MSLEKIVEVEIIQRGATYEGVELAIGDRVEIYESSALSVVAEGFAVIVGAPVAAVEEVELEDPEITVEKLRSALDGQYTLDGSASKPSLKDAALKAGVDFAFDAKKADIVAAIIEQGKAEELTR